ncbi:MAG TPA: haloacid dehalogenase type II, partial [Candidatus Baltobacteraceae bacterium]|nr:haloacid dehalogenase type II [Candidatus Baltobacteraceae bacterium]
VRHGERPWATLDDLHRESLDRLLSARGVILAEAERDWMTRAWHRLKPWPDTVPGMSRLRRRFILCSLSNGNLSLQVDLARAAGLPFDALLASDMFGHYKPDPETYLGALGMLERPASRVMLVAAHNTDLRAAASHGLRTAFVARPTEYGPRQDRDLQPSEGTDIVARDLVALATALEG